MAETVHLYLRGPAIPPLSFVFHNITWLTSFRPNPTGDGTTQHFLRTPPAGTTVDVTVELTKGALADIQRLGPLQGTDAPCFASLGRENSIECFAFMRSAKLLDVSQTGAKATVKLQLV